MPSLPVWIGIAIGASIYEFIDRKWSEKKSKKELERLEKIEESLPRFKYHPLPLHTEVFEHHEEAEDCHCCGKATNVLYTGAFESDDFDEDDDEDLFICPECVHSGAAAKKFGGYFQDPEFCDDVKDPAKLEELCKRTPCYDSLMPHWLAHCNDFCALVVVDIMDWDEIVEMKVDKEVAEDWIANEDLEINNLKEIKEGLGEEYVGYLFECIHCGKHRLYVDELLCDEDKDGEETPGILNDETTGIIGSVAGFAGGIFSGGRDGADDENDDSDDDD